MFKAVFALLTLLVVQVGVAQNVTVSGVVTDSDTGIPVPGVNVVQQGTPNGTSADFDGNYSITVPSNAVLVFSSLGFQDQMVSVNGRTTINVLLVPSAENLDEVVVTALGIKKETKALGYSLTEVKGEEVSNIKLPNAINALQGKVAGVNISQNATGAAGSSRVIIRGNSTMTGNNQPLYVVDGIPISNENSGSASLWGGNDGGDGISSINPDDIASVSVLKGGSASALYGSRGGNGVIIITTKQGKKQEGIGVEYNGSVLFNTYDSSILDFQTEYGQGILGRKPVTQTEAFDNATSSWGERLDGSSVVQWDGVERPYSYVGNNAETFYRTGATFTNTVSLTTGGEKMNMRFSASDLSNDDIVPNAGLNRKTFSLNANAMMAEKLSMQTNVKYIVQDVTNRPRLSDAPGNANFTVALLPANVDVSFMEPGANEDGTERQYSSNVFSQNPYWAAYNFSNQDKTNRIIASTNLRYDIIDWLYLSGRVGVDHWTRKSTSIEPWGTAYIPGGAMTEEERRYTQIDADLILGSQVNITDKLGFNGFVGANSNKIEFESLSLGGRDFIVPGLEDISNLATQTRSRGFNEREIGSLYGSLEFSYDSFLYLTYTGRNDWFSTLSLVGKDSPNNDFYSSINGSLILSDLFQMPAPISFLKLRGGYSETAGGAQDAYQLALTYEIFGQGHQGQPLGRINGSRVPNIGLVPWSKQEYEIGLDARFFNNRLSLDLAYYSNKTTDDIVNVTTSVTSGFSSAIANIGELENKGFEFLINATPFRTQDFSWNTSINGAYNKGTIVATNPEDGEIGLDEPRTQNVRISHIPGERYGVIKGVSYVRDEQGRIVYDIDEDGVPLALLGERKILGEGVPPWSFGFSNTFRFKDFSLYTLIDAKFGGQIFSGTNTFAYGSGLHKATLEGRENGLSVSGVDGEGNAFTTTVAPENLQTYYGRVNDIAEEFVEDADFIKFRQLSLNYTFPDKILEKTFLNTANIGIIMQNLFYIKRSVDNIDPEAAYNAGNSQGLEYFGVPPTRSYGLSLNVKF
ncbi:SusC/RagA family TonB-linked outer membrane protein [Croceivirga sp. JEA036]|nr:SusC/RagA family TonB-linked outer membrane protein [Croceivirga sp. JEA036]